MAARSHSWITSIQKFFWPAGKTKKSTMAWGDADHHTPDDGRVLRAEKDMRTAQAIVEFAGLRVKDVMIPSVDVISVDVSRTVAAAARIMDKKNVGTLIVYRRKLDDIIGVVDRRAIIAAMMEEKKSLGAIAFKPILTVTSMRVLDLFFMMSDRDIDHAVVVDEYGGVDGVVHAAAILERIFTEISKWREHSADGIMAVRPCPDGSYIVGARCRLEQIKHHIKGFRVDQEEYGDIDTIGGLVFSLAGRIPVRSEIIHAQNGFHFEIIRADSRRIQQLRIIPDSQGGKGQKKAVRRKVKKVKESPDKQRTRDRSGDGD